MIKIQRNATMDREANPDTLTDRWSQPLAAVMSTFDFMKPFSIFPTLAAASSGSAPCFSSAGFPTFHGLHMECSQLIFCYRAMQFYLPPMQATPRPNQSLQPTASRCTIQFSHD